MGVGEDSDDLYVQREDNSLMAGRLLRRSGIAVVLVAELLEWEPTVIFEVGIGVKHPEVDIFRHAWPTVDIIGFEPHPGIALGIKKFPGLLHRIALGRKPGQGTLYYSPNHRDGASLFAGDPNLESADVEIDSLDNLYGNLNWKRKDDRVLLWMDCEGSELDVLIGGEDFVKDVDVINVEMTGVPLRRGWPDPVEVNRWLLDHGFWLQFIHTHRITSGQNDVVYVKSGLFRPEYCSSPLQVEQWRLKCSK